MTQDLITVKQLPVIEERLQSISELIQAQTAEVLSLKVNEDTVKEIKKRRTELNKSFEALEDQRKAVKSAPYKAFEEVYKKYVTDVFKPADVKLKARIDEVENALLDNKKSEIAAYFQEGAAARGIDFVTFDRLGIKVTFSDSMKKLREQVDDALDKISGELALIGTLEASEEILVEYKDTLNLTNSVLTVKSRRAKLEAERQRMEAAQNPVHSLKLPVDQRYVAPAAAVTEPEPEAKSEIAKEPEPAQESQKSLITITVRVHSCDELMAITEVCKARRLEYSIS